VITVSALYIYPIKSCRGIELQGFRLDDLGPELDRRFMLVDENNKCITQREEPKLALVVPTLAPTAFMVRAPGMVVLKLPISLHDDSRVIQIEVWSHKGPALDTGDDASGWFSEYLGRRCRLVWFPRARLRRVSEKHSPEEAYTAFADGYPELLLSEESIADLGTRANTTFPVDRFRPNILVRGGEPYAEDSWKKIRIGSVQFDVVKPCERCVMTTIDQRTGEAASKEPLATLARYRREGSKVLFGQNCIHRELGTIRVGDQVELVS
jgi:uncharacterized protein YcbX